MPGFDGTGPLGQGPGTGRGLGPCGRGLYWRRRFPRFGLGWRWPWFRRYTPLTKEEEIAALEEELENIKQRLAELRGTDNTNNK